MIDLKVIREYAYGYLVKLDSAFGLPHMETTLECATAIAENEGADVEAASIAAILHDISLAIRFDIENETISDNHGIRSAILANDFLRTLGIDDEKRLDIYDAIGSHCFPGLQQSVIAKILWDADKLSMFAPKMEPEYSRYWQNNGLNQTAVAKRFIDYRQFYLSNFYTQTAKQMALRMGSYDSDLKFNGRG